MNVFRNIFNSMSHCNLKLIQFRLETLSKQDDDDDPL